MVEFVLPICNRQFQADPVPLLLPVAFVARRAATGKVEGDEEEEVAREGVGGVARLQAPNR